MIGSKVDFSFSIHLHFEKNFHGLPNLLQDQVFKRGRSGIQFTSQNGPKSSFCNGVSAGAFEVIDGC